MENLVAKHLMELQENLSGNIKFGYIPKNNGDKDEFEITIHSCYLVTMYNDCIDFNWSAFRDLKNSDQALVKKIVYTFMYEKELECNDKTAYRLPWVNGGLVLNYNKSSNEICYMGTGETSSWKTQFTKEEVLKIEEENDITAGTHVPCQ